MGVIDSYFVDNEVEDCCQQKVVDYAFDFSSMFIHYHRVHDQCSRWE
jgi:hypothetical protein